MMINSLEETEQIVENNESLRWDGWNIIHYKKMPTAWMKPQGAFIDGNWYVTKHYNVSEKGWDLPEKLMAKYHVRQA